MNLAASVKEAVTEAVPEAENGGLRFLDRLAAALAPAGLNDLGVVGRARYDAAAPERVRTAALHPGTRSIVVLASGGRLHWDRFLDWVAEEPRTRLARERHPLDAFGRSVLDPLGDLLAGCRVLFPHVEASPRLDFLRVAELAGLGRESELGLLVSERWGPWLGLRAAIFAPHELPERLPARRLCDGCSAPCRGACPVQLVGPYSFPWLACSAFRRVPFSPCRTGCDARVACVVAPEERYSDLERLYHENRPSGRRALCRHFGITDEVGS